MKIEELNLEQFKISQNFGETVSVKKVMTSIPMKKPGKHTFFRVKVIDGELSTFDCLLLEYENGIGKDVYFVKPDIANEISSEMVPKRIYIAIDRQNNLFLWPVKLPDSEGKLDSWNTTAHDAAKVASTEWARLRANQSLGNYEIHVAASKLSQPEWPEMTLNEMLSLAMKGKIIDSLDHPVIQKLKGNQ